jgi:ribosomal protein S5
MTRMGRVYNRRCLLYAGNKKGLLCYGVGRGKDYRSAYNNAYKELGKNLIAIPLDYNYNVPVALRTRFHDYRIRIDPRPCPNVWGNPVMVLMLRYAVIY